MYDICHYFMTSQFIVVESYKKWVKWMSASSSRDGLVRYWHRAISLDFADPGRLTSHAIKLKWIWNESVTYICIFLMKQISLKLSSGNLYAKFLDLDKNFNCFQFFMYEFMLLDINYANTYIYVYIWICICMRRCGYFYVFLYVCMYAYVFIYVFILNPVMDVLLSALSFLLAGTLWCLLAERDERMQLLDTKTLHILLD